MHRRFSIKGRNTLAVLVALLSILFLAACGGASTRITPAAGGTDASDSAKVDSRALALGVAIPALPADLGVAADRSASSAGSFEFTGTGDALLNYSGGTIDGDNLILTSSADEEAWAMYRAGGLDGLWVTTFGLLTIPGDLDTTYYVALGDFTKQTWDWNITTKLPEVDYDLHDNNMRLVSSLGYMYWVVAVPAGGKSVTVQLAKIIAEEQPVPNPWRPGGGNLIFASQGIPGVIHVEWGAIDGATGYELYRRLAAFDPMLGRDPGGDPAQEGDFELLATLGDNFYEDADVVAFQPYEYKVRAINEQGYGDYSEIAWGWAGPADGGGGQPPDIGDASAPGEITAYAEDSLTLNAFWPDPNAQMKELTFVLNADTVYLDETGQSVGWDYFAVGDHVFVQAMFGENEERIALAVMADRCDGGGNPPPPPDNPPFVGTITQLDDTTISILDPRIGEEPIIFGWGADTAWVLADGTPGSYADFAVGDFVMILPSENSDTPYAVLVQMIGDGGPGGDPPGNK